MGTYGEPPFSERKRSVNVTVASSDSKIVSPLSRSMIWNLSFSSSMLLMLLSANSDFKKVIVLYAILPAGTSDKKMGSTIIPFTEISFT